MCGICGIVLPADGQGEVTEELIVRMRDCLAHRGPDDAGLFVAPGVGLGHRRLSIIDLAGGHQPFGSPDQRLQIVYNGEVYNHQDLRRELEANGAVYRTTCDTETVLQLYATAGTAAPTRLRGMFAFAVWDRERRSLFLARDRFGIKPLYYAHRADGALFFASEIKALLAAGAVRPTLNRSALPELLANRAPMGEATLFEGIRRLLPGHWLEWRDGRVRITRYWDLTFQGEPHSTWTDAQWVSHFRDAFFESVRLRLMADVPLGMFLSGGIDSAAITAAMSSMVSEPIRTFSVAFAEREANELHYARLVAERYATDHHEIIVSPDDFFQALPRLIWHEDEPIAHPSSVPLHFVSRLAAEHVKVVLTGEGSDENLAGYPWHRATVYNHRLGRAYEGILPSGVRQAIAGLVRRGPMPSGVRRKLLRTFLTLPSDLDSILYDNFGVFGRRHQERLLSPDLRASLEGIDPYEAFHAAHAASDAASFLNRLLDTDLQTYLHELLMKQDQMSMSASLESRVPFLDHELAAFMATMPDRMKLRGLTTKYVLRRAMADLLPAPILSRRKMGFPVPIGAWLKGPYRHLVDEYVLGPRARERGLFQPDYVRRLVAEHERGEANHSERLWSLLNLELWHRIFLDGESGGIPPIEPLVAASSEGP